MFANSIAYADVFEPPIPLMNVDRHHKPICLKLDVEQRLIEEEFERFDFQRCDLRVLNERLLQADWSRLSIADSVDEAVERFYDELFGIIRAYVPMRRCKWNSHKRQPWWNADLRNLRNRLRRSRKRYFKRKNVTRFTEMGEI